MELITLLAATVHGRWRPGIGDPSVMGWVTVAAYLLGAWVCWRTYCLEVEQSRLLNVGGSARRSWLWLILALISVTLGINKQLDIQSLLTQVGRDLSLSQGWYPRRQVYQAWFIKAIALGGLVSLVLLCWLCRHDWRRRLLALVGMTGLLGFVLIRASSFHHVDHLLGMRLGGLKMNWILELGSIGCVTLAALLVGQDLETDGGELSLARSIQHGLCWREKALETTTQDGRDE